MIYSKIVSPKIERAKNQVFSQFNVAQVETESQMIPKISTGK